VGVGGEGVGGGGKATSTGGDGDGETTSTGGDGDGETGAPQDSKHDTRSLLRHSSVKTLAMVTAQKGKKSPAFCAHFWPAGRGVSVSPLKEALY